MVAGCFFSDNFIPLVVSFLEVIVECAAGSEVKIESKDLTVVVTYLDVLRKGET